MRMPTETIDEDADEEIASRLVEHKEVRVAVSTVKRVDHRQLRGW